MELTLTRDKRWVGASKFSGALFKLTVLFKCIGEELGEDNSFQKVMEIHFVAISSGGNDSGEQESVSITI